MPRKKNKVRDCRQCGTEISTRPSDPKVFCSKVCAYKFNRGSNHALWRTDKIKICLFCFSPFVIVRGWERTKKFCGVTCAKAHQQINGGPTTVPIGTVTQDAKGYRFIKIGPRNWRPEHRVIAERTLGRDLLPSELVHHRDGNPSNNAEENLQVVVSVSAHKKLHYEAERIGLSMMVAESWIPTAEGMGC